MDTARHLNLLILEDSEEDALQLVAELSRAGYDPDWQLVANLDDFRRALEERSPDIVLADYVLPGFTGLEALKLHRESGSDAPFILVSGRITEDGAVEALRAGAKDFISKMNLARLAPAVRRELSEAEARREAARTKRALQAAEDRFDTIAETAKDAIIIIDDNGCPVYWNRAAGEIFGYRWDEIAGKNLHTMLAPERFLKAHKAAFAGFRETGEGAAVGETLELEAVAKDGRVFPIELSLSVFKHGEKYHALGVVRDITERRRMQTELLQSQKMEAIGTLASGIAHELNTPAQYVGGNLEFLQTATESLAEALRAYKSLLEHLRSGAVESSEVEELAARYEELNLDFLAAEMPSAVSDGLEGIVRLTKIVSAMRDFGKPGESGKSLNDINRAVESTVTISRNEWKYVADLETELEEGLPPVYCCVSDINNALLHLIVNAAQAVAEKLGERPEQKGIIRVTTIRDDDRVVIRVRDNGVGIPPENRERIFEPFYTTRTVGKGVGQGLAAVRSIIVEDHGGEVAFESTPGEGSEFTIRLPLGQEEDIQDEKNVE